jgi:hypothetical protein
MSVERGLLHVKFKGELVKGELIFSNLVEISLHRYAFFDLRDLIILSISLGDVGLHFIFGYCVIKVSNINCMELLSII